MKTLNSKIVFITGDVNNIKKTYQVNTAQDIRVFLERQREKFYPTQWPGMGEPTCLTCGENFIDSFNRAKMLNEKNTMFYGCY